MGSLLLLSGSNIFAAREIDGAPKLSAKGPDMYLLDGQQRVTALYHAVTDNSKYCYYIDFEDLANDGSEIVKWMHRKTFDRHYGSLALRAGCGVALVRDVWEAAGFFEWLSHIRSEAIRTRCIRLRDEKLGGFHSMVYQVMAIELEEGLGVEALSRIFETINRTGVALNAFDLLVAKLYPTSFKLRERWNEALRQNPILRHFSPDELEVLKLISLLIRTDKGSKHSKGVRQGDILSIAVQDIIEYWDAGIRLYVDALKLAITLGAVCKDVVPNWSMILGLAGCVRWSDQKNADHWWTNAIVNETFSQSANTKIVAEFDGRMKTEPAVPDEVLTAEEFLRRGIRANGLLSKGLACQMIRKQGRDPITGILLTQSSSILFKTLAPNGGLYNAKASDQIRHLVLVSGEGESQIASGLEREGPHWKSGLLSQGIDPVVGARSASYIQDLFEGRIN